MVAPAIKAADVRPICNHHANLQLPEGQRYYAYKSISYKEGGTSKRTAFCLGNR